MIGICTRLFDLDGAIILADPDLRSTNVDNFSRRVSRVATLDGGAAVSDFGYTAADRTFTVAFSVRHAAAIILGDLMKLHSLFVLSTREGAFFAAGNSYTITGGLVVATFLITDTA